LMIAGPIAREVMAGGFTLCRLLLRHVLLRLLC
jgi:hypothetical protein